MKGKCKYAFKQFFITGSQSLFGVKTELQFGKTKVTAVFSEQKSQSKSVVSEGGGTVEEYEIFARITMKIDTTFYHNISIKTAIKPLSDILS